MGKIIKTLYELAKLPFWLLLAICVFFLFLIIAIVERPRRKSRVV